MDLTFAARIFVCTAFFYCAGPNPCIAQPPRPAAVSGLAAPLAPQDALEAFQLNSDFRIELVASEPLVQDPVAMAFDEHGDLFVVEFPEFNQYQFPPDARRSGCVKRLKDEDGDGIFDSATVFLRMPFTTAVICYGGGVFVGAPPHVLFCKDIDGDGVADEKKIVLTGFDRDFAGGGLLNSFRWGLDHQIHLATGFAGGQVRRAEVAGAEAISVRQRGIILDPRTLDFEATSGGGQHGMTINDIGDKFLCSNVYPLQRLAFDDRYIARNPFFVPPPAARDINAAGPLAELGRISPLEPWRVDRSASVAAKDSANSEATRPGGVFTSASGIMVYRGHTFPTSYYGNLFVGEVANNLVYRARLESNGIQPAAARADSGREFLASRDNWFRPVQLGNGPDGALYVVDMYRQLIEGAAFVPENSLLQLDPSAGTERGRIYRVVPRDHPRFTQPHLEESSVKHLVELLEHPNSWHRETAARLLIERRPTSAIPALKEMMLSSQVPRSRVLSLYMLRRFEVLTGASLLVALADSSPLVREHALRLAEAVVSLSPQLQTKMVAMTADPDARVRYQLAFSLGAFVGRARNGALVKLARQHSENQDYLVAIQSSLREQSSDVLAALVALPEEEEKLLRPWLRLLVRQIARQGERREVAGALQAVQKITDHRVAQTYQEELLAHLDRQKFREVEGTESLDALVTELLGRSLQLALQKDMSTDQRVQAIRALAWLDREPQELRSIFHQLLAPDQAIAIQLAACDAMGNFSEPFVFELLRLHWKRLTPLVRRRAGALLLTRNSWSLALLDAVESGLISPHDMNAAEVQQFLARVDGTTKERIAKNFHLRSGEARQKIVTSYKVAASRSGNREEGQKVYRRVCAGCHQVQGLGKEVGPPLRGLQTRSTEKLLIDILDPGRELKPLFQNFVVRLDDGRILTGMILHETTNGIRLQQTDGMVQELLRTRIEEIRSTGVSFMPEGMEKQITVEEMSDLLAFLRS